MDRNDYARGGRGRGRDRMMDGRNPYGSRGGYVTSRPMRGRRDRMMEDDGNYRDYTSRYDAERGGRRSYGQDGRRDYEMDGRDYERRGQYDRDGRDYGDYARRDRMMRERDYEMRYDRGEDYGMDYARGRDYGYDYGEDYGEDKMSDQELMEWGRKLMKEVDEKDKAFFHIENVEKRAKEIGIKFEKYTFSEMYVTALMLFDDYKDVLGTSNPDLYLHLACAWLKDEDSNLKYGEKLAAYHDCIVKG